MIKFDVFSTTDRISSYPTPLSQVDPKFVRNQRYAKLSDPVQNLGKRRARAAGKA